MKILFIHSTDDALSFKYPYDSFEFIAFGISYISAYLKQKNHTTELVVLSSQHSIRRNNKRLLGKIETYQPDLLLYTAVSSQYQLIKNVAARAKKHYPEIFSVIGGVHATVMPEEVINGPFDAICVGEGEMAIQELVENIKNTDHSIMNLWFKNGDDIIKNPSRAFFENLDEIPEPDREMWLPWIKLKSESRISVLIGRGCPYKCTYCSNHVFKKLADGKYVRTRSVGSVINEIDLLSKQYPDIDHFYLEIEDILTSKKWAIDLCEELIKLNSNKGHKLKFSCNYRVTLADSDESFFQMLERANFVSINIGLESGSPKIREEVLKRRYSNENFLSAVKFAKKANLKVYIYNLIGLPGESWEDYLQTVSVNRLSQPDGVYTSIFFPYPGTDLYQFCVEQKYLPKNYRLQRERRHSILKQTSFSRLAIQWAYFTFEFRVYFGNNSIGYLLLKMIHLMVMSNPLLNKIFKFIVGLPFVNVLTGLIRK